MIAAAEKSGALKRGGTIVEATAGNTGLGLPQVGIPKGYRIILVVPDKMSREKIQHLRALGAEVRMTRSDVGKGHPEYYQDMAQKIAAELPGAFYANQFANPANPLAHETTTGPEIFWQLEGDVDALGEDIDIRTDVPRYRVWRNGELADEPRGLRAVWRDDLVSFVIGCSFSFEEALLQNGVPVRHIERGTNVPMYRTNVATARAGRFHGPMVVSMRPLKPADAIRAVQITTRLPSVHGAPVHIGFPEEIGIGDIAKPDYGDAVPVEQGELPVFWACGVTPQAAIVAARPPFAITHAPGFMLVTDLQNAQLSLF